MQVVQEQNRSRLPGPPHPSGTSGRPSGARVLQSVSDVPVAQKRAGRQVDVGSVCTQKKSSAERGSPGRRLPLQQRGLAGLQQAVQQVRMFTVLSV